MTSDSTCTLQNQRRIAAMLMILFLALSADVSALATRPWRVQDTIELSKISICPRSQDQRYLPVVTSRGLLQSNQIESKLWLFDTTNAKSFIESDTAQYAPAGKLLVTMFRKSIGAKDGEMFVISSVRWAPDAKSLYFLARSGKNSEHVLFSVDLQTLQTSQLSEEGHDVTAFDIAGGVCAYTKPAQPATSPEGLFQSAGRDLPDIELAGGKAILDLLYPNRPKFNFEFGPENLWIVKQGKVTRAVDIESKEPLSFISKEQRVSVSPDGKYAILLQRAVDVPSSWEQYTPNS